MCSVAHTNIDCIIVLWATIIIDVITTANGITLPATNCPGTEKQTSATICHPPEHDEVIFAQQVDKVAPKLPSFYADDIPQWFAQVTAGHLRSEIFFYNHQQQALMTSSRQSSYNGSSSSYRMLIQVNCMQSQLLHHMQIMSDSSG